MLEGAYTKYWDKYKVSEEEKNNEIEVEGVGTVTQTQIYNAANNSDEYNQARLNITKETFNNMSAKKGIGVNEVTESFSFLGAWANGTTYSWIKTVADVAGNANVFAQSWNEDMNLIGHAGSAFVVRGRLCG